MLRRVLTYIGWAALVIITAVAFFMTGSVLAMCVSLVALVAPIAGLALVWANAGKVRVSLEGKTSAQKGSDVVVYLCVTNESGIPMPNVQVSMEVTNLLTSQVNRSVPKVSVARHSQTKLPLHISSEVCGRIELHATKISVFEPMGVFSKTAPCDEVRRLSIMPNLQDAYLRNVMSASPLSDTTMFSPYFKGQDLSEVFSLRDYEPGDELRRIHWKLSEKVGDLIVREPSLPLDNSILVFWDKTLYGMDNNPLRADAMAEVALALCVRLVRSGISFNVAYNNAVESRCINEFIADENDIYEMIGHLMSSPMVDGQEGGLDLYVDMFGALRCSRLIYISAGLPPVVRDASANMAVMAFVCDDDDSVEADGNLVQIHFHSGNAEAALASAGVM